MSSEGSPSFGTGASARTAGRGQSLPSQPTNERKTSQNASTASISPSREQSSPRSPSIPAVRTRQKSWKGSLRSETQPPQKSPELATPRSRERVQAANVPATGARGSGSASPPHLPIVTREEMEKEAQKMLILENSNPGEAPPSTDFVPVDLDQEPADFDLLATAASFTSYNRSQSENHTHISQTTELRRSSAKIKSVSTSGTVRVQLASAGTTGTKRSPAAPTSRSPVSGPHTVTTTPTKSPRLASTSPAALQIAPVGVPSHSAIRAAARAATRSPFANIPAQRPEPSRARSQRTPSPRLLSGSARSTAVPQRTVEASRRSSTTKSLSQSQVSAARVSPARVSPVRVSPSQGSPARASPARASTARVSTGRVSPSPASPGRVSPAAASSARVSPTRASPVRGSPTGVSTARSSPARVSSSRVSTAAASSSRVSPTRVSPARVSTARVSPSRASPARVSTSDSTVWSPRQEPSTPRVKAPQTLPARTRVPVSQASTAASRAQTLPSRVSPSRVSTSASTARSPRLQSASPRVPTSQTSPVRSRVQTSPASPARTRPHVSQASTAASRSRSRPSPSSPRESRPQEVRTLPQVGKRSLTASPETSRKRFPPASAALHRNFVAARVAQKVGQNHHSDHAQEASQNSAKSHDGALDCQVADKVLKNLDTDHKCIATEQATDSHMPEDGYSGHLSTQVVDGTTQLDFESECMLPVPSKHTSASQTRVKTGAAAGPSTSTPRGDAHSGSYTTATPAELVDQAASESTAQLPDVDQSSATVEHFQADISLTQSTSGNTDAAQSRQFQNWKSFGNRTFNYQDSLKSTCSAGALASGNTYNADTANGDGSAPSIPAEMIRTSIRNPLRERARSQPAAQVQSTDSADTIATRGESAGGADISIVPNGSIQSNVSCSSSNEPSGIGTSGSMMFFLPAPRKSLLRRAGEDARDLISMWSTVHRTTTTNDNGCISSATGGARPQLATTDRSTVHDTASSQVYHNSAVQKPVNEESGALPMAGHAALPPISDAQMQDESDTCGQPDQIPSPPPLSDANEGHLSTSESFQNRTKHTWYPISEIGTPDKLSHPSAAGSSNAAESRPSDRIVHHDQSASRKSPWGARAQSLSTSNQITSSIDLYGVNLQPPSTSIEGAHPSTPDCRESSACFEVTEAARSGFVCASHPLSSSARSMSSAPGSAKDTSGPSSSTASGARSDPGNAAFLLGPPSRSQMPTISSWGLITSVDGGPGAAAALDSIQQSIPEHLRTVCVAQSASSGRFASWLSQTVGTAPLSKGRSQESLAAPRRDLVPQEERKVESSADILNTLNIVQDCNHFSACTSAPDSVEGTGNTSTQTCADAEKSSNSSFSQMINRSAGTSKQQATSQPRTGTEQSPNDPSGPFPEMAINLPESQQPGPTPKSQMHSKELSTSMDSCSMESPEHTATPLTPCVPLRSAHNSSRQVGSDFHSNAFEGDADPVASITAKVTPPSSLKPPQPASVRLTRESCFSGDSVTRLNKSSTEDTLNESQGSNSKSSGSESGTFQANHAMEQPDSCRTSHRAPNAAADRIITFDVDPSDARNADVDRSSSEGNLPTISKYVDFRCTEMVIGNELQDLAASLGADNELETDNPNNRSSELGFNPAAQNRAISHPVTFDSGQHDDLEHTYTQVVRRSTVYDTRESLAHTRESTQKTEPQNEEQHRTRSSSPFEVEGSNLGRTGDAHDSTMSGMSSSMWTLSSPEPSFKAAADRDTATTPPQQSVLNSTDPPLHTPTASAGNGPDSHALLHSELSLLSDCNRSTSSVVMQSFSGWNNLTGQIASEVASVANTPSSDCSVEVKDRKNAIRSAQTETEQESAGKGSEASTANPSMMTIDPLVQQEGAGTSASTQVHPVEPAGAEESCEEPSMVLDSAPVSLDSPSILATLWQMQMQSGSVCMPSGQGKGSQSCKRRSTARSQVGKDELHWGDVESAWARACDAATQIPVLAVLLSPFIPAPIPCIIPFVSPFYSPKLALAPWALGMRAQMASCDAAPSPQDRVVPAGEPVAAQVSIGTCSTHIKPPDVQHTLGNASEDIVIADHKSQKPQHTDKEHPPYQQPDLEPSQQAAEETEEELYSHPLIFRVSEDQLLDPAILRVLSSTASANAATCLEFISPDKPQGTRQEANTNTQINTSLSSEFESAKEISTGASAPGPSTTAPATDMSSSTDNILKDLETYASIGHEQRALIYGKVATTRRDGPLSLLQRRIAAFTWGSKNTNQSSTAAGLSSGAKTPTSVLCAEAETAAVEADTAAAVTSTLESVQDPDTEADGAALISYQLSLSAGSKSSGSLQQRVSDVLTFPEPALDEGDLAAQSRVSSSGEESTRSSLFQDTISLSSAQPPDLTSSQASETQACENQSAYPRLCVESLSGVGITPEVLKSLALPYSDEDLQALTLQQQTLMIKLFLGKDSTVREAAKDLHHQATINGSICVPSILRASADYSASSRSFTGFLDRSTADSVYESVYASSSSAGIHDSQEGPEGQGLGAPNIYKKQLQRKKERNDSNAVKDRGEGTAADDNSNSNRQRCVFTKRVAYTALALSVVLSGIVWATDGDVIGEVLDRMHRGATKGETRRYVENRKR